MIRNKKTTGTATNTAVLPDKDITAICEHLGDMAKTDTLHAQALILFNLCLLTHLRIGHICSLIRSEIEFDDRNGMCVIVSSSKGTRGNTRETVIGADAGRFIRKAMKISEANGLGCPQEHLRDYLFLYTERGRYDVWTPRKLGVFLSKTCETLGIGHYMAKNLRATYMTKAFIECSEDGAPNEYLLKLFAYHRNAGTTLEHYVNHDEALSNLQEFLKRGNDWQKTIYPDERESLRNTIREYEDIIASTVDEEERTILVSEMNELIVKLESMNS